MTSIIIIDKNGILSEKKIKTFDKLYSSCNYRTNKDFELLHTWNDSYELYGKKTGKPINENKYELPLLEDTYYGNLCIVKKGNSLSLEEWNKFRCNTCYEIPFESMEPKLEHSEDTYYLDNTYDKDKESEGELSYDDYEEETK